MATAQRISRRCERLMREIAAMPQVVAIGGSRTPPYSLSTMAGSWNIGGKRVRMTFDDVTDGYPKAMNIPILRGRWFKPEDDAAGFQPVVIDTRPRQGALRRRGSDRQEVRSGRRHTSFAWSASSRRSARTASSRATTSTWSSAASHLGCRTRRCRATSSSAFVPERRRHSRRRSAAARTRSFRSTSSACGGWRRCARLPCGCYLHSGPLTARAP